MPTTKDDALDEAGRRLDAIIASHDGAPIIFACAGRDELFRRFGRGDQAALRMLLHSVPQDLPAKVLRAFRDDEIRALADRLRSIMPDASRDAIARLLAEAGRAVGAGEPLRSDLFAGLTGAERAELAEAVRDIIAWAPTTKRGSAWPRRRQITAILAG